MDCILDALIDLVKLIPFLFFTYLCMEYLEGHLQDKVGNILRKAGKSGPLWGSALGIIPQCGFSAFGANFYAGHLISVGTVVAIFLSTSDEMLPLLLSAEIPAVTVILILLGKAVIGLLIGFLTDFVIGSFFSNKIKATDIHHFCEHEHCKCGHNILKPALMHTLRIGGFIFVISAILNIIIEFVGLENVTAIAEGRPVLGVLIACIVGLIPNCGASVAIATLFIDGVIPVGTMMGGLLTGAGVGLLVLFKVNDDIKENLIITSIIFVTGLISGILINLVLL